MNIAKTDGNKGQGNEKVYTYSTNRLLEAVVNKYLSAFLLIKSLSFSYEAEHDILLNAN